MSTRMISSVPVLEIIFTYLEDVKSDPFTPPKVERATEIGMIQAMTPNSFSPKVCGARAAEETVCG